MKKVMLAADCSAHSKRAAEYLARVAPHIPNCRIVLFSVTTGIPYGDTETLESGTQPPELHGDEDHRQEQEQLQSFHSNVKHLLEERGIDKKQVKSLIKPLLKGVSQDILEEALACGCDTIVVGRRGLSRVKEMLMGSVSSDLIHRASGVTVWVVE